MSQIAPGESRRQDIIDAARDLVPKCRIPQRLTQARQRPLAVKPKLGSNPDSMSRPKSANRSREHDPSGSGKSTHAPMVRSARPERERLLPALKRPSTIPKRVINDNMVSKTGRSIITVPISQRQQTRLNSIKNGSLPTQNYAKNQQRDSCQKDKIMKREELELLQSELADAKYLLNELHERESLTSPSDVVVQLKINWQENMDQFEKMKNDLKDRQNAIMELYAVMRNTHQKMTGLGQKVSLPSAEDLSIMNISKMTPEQLLQLCAPTDPRNFNEKSQRHDLSKSPLTIDVNKLHNMPTKLLATCEQTLSKRKEIIDWFETLKSQDKKISMNMLTNKIKEFYAENDMLQCSLEQVKSEFLNELQEIVEFLRKNVNEKITLQLRTEELTYELSELNSQNNDLRKQIHNSDHLKSQTNRNRMEELEKELKDEKCKKIVIRDRLSRAEGQIKIGTERASQLEAALEHARSQTWSLERTVQQLHEQNQKLQTDFDKELNKLTDSIREHTVHLEDIAEAREKLQSEKDDLEKRLAELSDHYNESLKNIKHEMNVNVAKLIETENKYDKETEEKKNLQVKIESLCAQLLESELRHKDLAKQLEEKELQLSNTINCQRQLEATKKELNIANSKVDDYRNQLVKQNEALKEMECKFIETINLEENLKDDLLNKEEYIAELEKKQSLLEQQLQESASKMGSYEEQLSSLKNHIAQLQEDFGEFENLNDLHEMINQQRAKLLETTRQNGELAEALQKKDAELERHVQHLAEQEHFVEQRETIMKMLSEKEAEQTNIIKLLRNNLEMRAQADTDLNHQLAEKNAEIDSLITNVETRKQQISQLEKIILTLEDQTRKASSQRRKNQDMISLLEKKIAEYEIYHLDNKRSMGAPNDNLDNLIKILEDELGSPFETQLNTKDHEYTMMSKKKHPLDRKREKVEKFECHEGSNEQMYQTEHESVLTKTVRGNYVKKTYISTNDEQFKGGDNLDRKKAITNIDTLKWIPTPEAGVNVYATPTTVKDNSSPCRGRIPVRLSKDDVLSRNLHFLTPNQLRDEKKHKMFKFAGHRL